MPDSLSLTARDTVAGYIPSLEAIPFLEWAGEGGLQIQARPGCGNIVRGLLTGSIDVGLIPWELFVSDLLSRKGQSRAWKIPAVFKACPMELALSQSARKRVYQTRKRSRSAGSVDLVFGVEAKHSFTKRQIVSWLEAVSVEDVQPPRFKVLPMKLMMKALRMGEVDGVVAPSPWGLQAEVEEVGTVDPSFNEGDHAQSLVMVCSSNLVGKLPYLFSSHLAGLLRVNTLEGSSEAFAKWSMILSSSGSCPLSQNLFKMASERYPVNGRPGDFVPDAVWLERELEALVSRRALSMEANSIREIAQALSI